MEYSQDQITKLRQVYAEIEKHINITKVTSAQDLSAILGEIEMLRAFEVGITMEYEMLKGKLIQGTDLNVALGAATHKLAEFAHALEKLQEEQLLVFAMIERQKPGHVVN